MLKKQIFEQRSSCNIFKSMLDMNVRFFGGRKTSHGLTLKQLPDPQTTQRRKPPHLQSTVAYFGVFWVIFTYSLSQARNQSTYEAYYFKRARNEPIFLYIQFFVIPETNIGPVITLQIYIFFFHLQNIAQLLLGRNFHLTSRKFFFRPEKLPRKANFQNFHRIFHE